MIEVLCGNCGNIVELETNMKTYIKLARNRSMLELRLNEEVMCCDEKEPVRLKDLKYKEAVLEGFLKYRYSELFT